MLSVAASACTYSSTAPARKADRARAEAEESAPAWSGHHRRAVECGLERSTQAARSMTEVERKEGKAPRREEELVEAALVVSGVKKLAPAVLVARWSWLWWPLPAALPSPVLFLLLNVVIASIVVASVQPVRRAASSSTKGGVAADAASASAREVQGARKLKKRRSKKRGEEGAAPAAALPAVAADCCMALVVSGGVGMAATDEEGAAGDAAAAEEEVDRRAEEFISAFRHRLRVDSFSSLRRDSEAGEAALVASTVPLSC